MSLPPQKAAPKSAAAVSGPGAGPSPVGQLRAALTSVSLPPGAPAAPQPPAAPPQHPRIARLPPALEDRIFASQSAVATVYSVPRHPGPPYVPHDITKGHHNLTGTAPGHASSTPGLSQSPYTPGQNVGSAPLLYSPQTQPMNAQPQSRPFAPGPRHTHHQGGFRPIQFFQRAQMQTARAPIPGGGPSLQPGSQPPAPAPPAAAVYQPNQPIMMTMAPMPFPSPQAPQYYIHQYRHSTPYIGPPQQFSVQPPGPGTFYPGPGPGDFPAPYTGPPYYSGQTVYPPSPPIIVPTPQQPPPAKREKKTIRIRDPNQGGKDITEEILSGGAGSRNPTPPVGRPSSTPTLPQFLCPHPHYPHIFYLKSQQLGSQLCEHGPLVYGGEASPSHPPVSADTKPPPDQKLESESFTPKSSSPGLRLSDSPSVRRGRGVPTPLTLPLEKPELAAALGPGGGPAPVAGSVEPPSPQREDIQMAAPPAAPSQGGIQGPPITTAPPPKAMNGHSDQEVVSTPPDEQTTPAAPQAPPPVCSTGASMDTQGLSALEMRAKTPLMAPGPASPTPKAPSLPTTAAVSAVAASPVPAASPSSPTQAGDEAGDIRKTSPRAETQEHPHKAGGEVAESSEDKVELQQQANSRMLLSTAQTASAAPKTWKKPKDGESPERLGGEEDSTEGSGMDEASPQSLELRSHSPADATEPLPTPEENGEAELVGNGAAPGPEVDVSDGGAEPGEGPCRAPPPYIFQGEPVEPNGKRQYGRDFLLGFQFTPACMQKPDGLPPISDVVLDKINQNKQLARTVDPRTISWGPDFTPAFADFGRPASGGRGSPLLNVSTRRPQPRKIIMNVSVNDDVQLRKAENAWKPGIKHEGLADDPDSQHTQELFRKVRSILNKLTPQMFNQLMKQVTDLTIDTEERLKGVIDLVFEKAIDEPSFSVAYSNMCRCLATLKVPMADKPSATVNFRKLLLNRCQKEFERDKVDDDVFERKQKELDSAASASERERLQEELEEAKDKARRRSIGNIKFIGELFKLKMLTEAIMHDCVVKLLKNHDEESLECLCRLLTTIGKDLDFEKAKPRMDQYFHQMEKIVKERKTSSRIRFMLQDVIDLRLHNWVSRRVDQGPKTIEQIHKEARIEEQEEQRKVHQQLMSKDNKRRPDQREQRLPRDDTWSTVPVTKNSRTIDPSKIPKISKPTIDDKIQLGPRAQVNWIKGSSGGVKASDSDPLRSTGSSLNRFCALQPAVTPASAAAATQDFDSRRLPGSRNSTGQERNDKPPGSSPLHAVPLLHDDSAQELLDSPALEETCQEAYDIAAAVEERANPEQTLSDELVKLEAAEGPGPEKFPVPVEEMERRCKAIMEEFLHITDYKEAAQCVEELEQEAQLHVFVRLGVESTLERSQTTRENLGLLFCQLLQSGTLPKEQLFKGFAETLELADDMAIDIPHVWLYLAQLLSPVLQDGGLSMRQLFSELSKFLLPVGRAGILFSEILHLLCKQMSHRKVAALWRESGLSWSDFLPEGEDVQVFISKQNLEFTTPGFLNLATTLSKRALSPEEISEHLEKLLLEDGASDEQIFDWVEANMDESEMSSSPFLRALMTAVCKAAVRGESTSCRVDTSIIQRRLPVLLKYLNSDTERQLQALYALQALMVSLDQPPNLLRMFFDCLYDEDVISEDAFYKWETSKDPAEQRGKGVALKSVTAFFTWLREAEEESEDN
ncbi:eukaryotic translation initiation factor 4 gamma 3 isoform X1 [Brienomyrus brachyistius]|uniref:eukaryotic translation initiation factor 4 gamma 3 isoform X1 n=1 Tax=Brienomyrus brachyistius TaxID=42636 RepID=UPI0020B37269|nr:eukaryotic translation initiation factor 4 gamma 3 isoform X1 [Brienomyrus brachyistius]